MKQLLVLEFTNGQEGQIELAMPMDIKRFSFADGVTFKRYLGDNNPIVFYKQMRKSIGKGVVEYGSVLSQDSTSERRRNES